VPQFVLMVGVPRWRVTLATPGGVNAIHAALSGAGLTFLRPSVEPAEDGSVTIAVMVVEPTSAAAEEYATAVVSKALHREVTVRCTTRPA
jgi:hypothetical protein